MSATASPAIEEVVAALSADLRTRYGLLVLARAGWPGSSLDRLQRAMTDMGQAAATTAAAAVRLAAWYVSVGTGEQEAPDATSGASG